MITKQELIRKYDLWYQTNKNDVDRRYQLMHQQMNNLLERFGSNEKLSNMSIDEYIFKKGGNKNALCYLLDYGTDELGMIRVNGQSGYQRYGIQLKDNGECFPFCIGRNSSYGNNKEDVFKNLKDYTIDLFKASMIDDIKLIDSIKLPQLYKNKLHYAFSNGNSIPIYVKPHLDKICHIFSIDVKENDSVFLKRTAIFQYLKSLNRPDITPWHFMNFLYREDEFALKPKSKITEIIKETYTGKIKKTKIDINASHREIEKNQNDTQEVGKAGEKFVYEYLKEHKNEFHIKSGTDILDMTDNPTPGIHCDFMFARCIDGVEENIYIEVKSTSRNDPRGFHFQMSCYEYKFMLENKNNYYLYYVNNVHSPKKIIELTPEQVKELVVPLKYFCDN